MSMMREASKLVYRYSEIMVFGFFVGADVMIIPGLESIEVLNIVMAQETAGYDTHSAVKYVRCSIIFVVWLFATKNEGQIN
jgi:hypothetical protein